MKQSFLTKTCTALLLAFVATAWCNQAWAIIINVRADDAPNIYAWNGNTTYNGAYPGNKITNTRTVGGKSWYYISIDATNVNIIISKGNNSDEANGTKTDNIENITGTQYFTYNPNVGQSDRYSDVTDYYDFPNGVNDENGNYVYVVNTNNWTTVYAYVYVDDNNKNAAWPGQAMTKVGKNGNGFDVYKWTGTTPSNPQKIIFNNNNNGSQTSDLDWENGACYSNYGSGSHKASVTGILLDSDHFPDANMRTALTAATGIQENGIIETRNKTILDINNNGISDLTGIANFTNLEELDISNNNVSFGDITALTKLKKIVAHHNPGLQGFGKNPPNSSNPVLKISSSSVLEYVDISNTDAYYLTQLNNCCGSTLETLIAANNPRFDYSTFTSCSVLKHLDLSNCGLTSTALNADHLNCPNLEYLDCSGNSRLISSGVYLTNLSKLKYFDMSGCNATPVNTVSNLANAKSTLEYLDLSNNQMTATGLDPALDGFTALKTFKFNTQPNWGNALSVSNCPELTYIDAKDNAKMTGLTINNCPKIETIDISNNALQTSLSITNSGLEALPAITGLGTTQALKTIDLTGNEFIAVPSIDSQTVTVLKMNNNKLRDISLPTGSNIEYLYAQNNKFPAGPYSLTQSSLVGLDLANNSFTEFTATGNESLLSLSLSPNAELKIITLHGNALTQTSPDGKIESDNGLYIRYLSSLDTLNIEHSSFKKLGQEKSLEGVSNLKKLQARYNKFTTFTNSVYDIVASGKNYRPADPTESSLEYLTSLEYLDLSHNELRDSVYLYYNTALKHLDVSHNRHITGAINGPLSATQKEAMIKKKGMHLMKYGKVYGNQNHDHSKPGEVGYSPDETDWQNAMSVHGNRLRPFDLRDEDLNDTTGLYHLDLGRNVNLEWLDFSYTNIHNTAAGPGYMNPGWMDKDWVTDLDYYAEHGEFKAEPSVNTTTTRVHSSWHTYVYFIPCSKLKTIHADHNNMNSFGFRYFPELDTLTCSYMYGDCARMRDFGGTGDLLYGYGNTSISPSTTKFDHYDLETIDDEGNPKIIYERYSAEQQYFPNPIKYLDVSNSGFNEFRVNPGVNLEYVNLSGNPLNFNVPWHDLTDPVYNSLDLTYCPNIITVKADSCSNLPTVRAHNRSLLTSLSVTGDTLLKTIYVQNDEVLPAITGLSTLTRLETLFAYNNILFGANNFDVSSNTALKNLWISNIGIDADALNLTNNTALEKLRVYDNTLTVLDVTKNTALTWLDFARNKVPRIDLSKNTALQFFNCSNSSENLAELAKTVTDNHDGSDFDTSKPSSIADTQANNGHNSLSDLVFATNAPIADVRANYNDLHCIKGSFGNLERIEFAHNHINGIDLSAASSKLTANNIVDNDNGREITAEFSTFSKYVNNVVQEYKVYFFQLKKDAQGHGAPLLEDKTSTDTKNNPRVLDEDGFVLSSVNAWGGSDNNAALLTTSSSPAPSMLRGTTVTPTELSPLDPNQVQGTIVVLNPTEEDNNGATGRATYTYNNGISDSEFYLDWSSDGQTVTGINGIAVIDGVSIAGNYGSLTVNGADGTVVDVYDMSGRQVAHETIGGGSVTIDGLTPGIYIVNGNKVVVK